MPESPNIPRIDNLSEFSGIIPSGASLSDSGMHGFEPLSYFHKYNYKYAKYYKVYTISSVHLVEAETALAAFIKQKDTSPTRIITCLAASLFHSYDSFV